MRPSLQRFILIIVLTGPLMINSCSKSKSTGPKPLAPPALSGAGFNPVINFLSTDSSAHSAKNKVLAEISQATGYVATPGAFATATTSTQWSQTADSCMAYSSQQGSCTTTYKACPAAGSYAWSKTLNGTCGGVARNQWVAIDGTSNGSGSSGTLHLYRDGTTTVDTTWSWTFDDTSKTWNFYRGTLSESNRLASLKSSKGANNSSIWTFEQTGVGIANLGAGVTDHSQWVLTVASSQNAGSMNIYAWTSTAGVAGYWLKDRITWNTDSTGSWTQYNASGSVISQSQWPVSTRPPHIRGVNIGHDVVINSNDQNAQIAKAMAEGSLAAARGLLTLGSSFLSALDSLHWGNPVNGCWSWNYTSMGCTGSYQICQSGNDYTWNWTLDGSCGGYTYSHWKAVDGTSSVDGGTGAFHFYQTNTTTIASTWKWSTAADGKSGSSSFYHGDDSPANLDDSITWRQNADSSSDVTFESFSSGRSKWVTHVSADGMSGTMGMYDWDSVSLSYWLQTNIIWNSNGTGSMTTYDENGTVLNEVHW